MGLPFEEAPLPRDCAGPPYDLAKVLRMRPRRQAISVAEEGELGLRINSAELTPIMTLNAPLRMLSGGLDI